MTGFARRLICSLLCVGLLTPTVLAVGPAFSDRTYESYTYGAEGTQSALTVPAPYTVQRELTAADLGLAEPFSELSDIVHDGSGTLYLSDTGNDRVIVTDLSDPSAPRTVQLHEFTLDGAADALGRPVGLCLSDTLLYVADTENARIVVFDRSTLSAVRVLERPQIPILGADYIYQPMKLGVTAAGHIYVIAEGVNQGLIELDENGAFVTFLGAPAVVPDLLSLIWRRFATPEQLAQMEKYVPTEYDAMQVDDAGFIYAVSKNSEDRAFAKLNHQGNNVLGELGQLGDRDGNKPYLADLVADDGVYWLLDPKQGKVFVYADEVGLLFAFGTNATQKGCFSSASAMEVVDGELYVLDGLKNTVTVFAQTAFGRDAIAATRRQKAGKYEESTVYWEKVAQQCAHYPPAQIGLAQVKIDAGEYKAAMAAAKAIGAKDVYDDAFDRQRDALLRGNLLWVVLGICAIAAAAVLVPRLVRRTAAYRRLAGAPLWQQLRYGTYAAFHPFDGYWEIKRAKKGSMPAALIILGLFTLLYAVRAQFSGYAVTGVIGSKVNVLFECLTVLLPLLLYVVANWCFTTLMDGEGTLRDVFIAACYALKPYVLLSVPLLLLSHVLTAEEAVFYQFFNVVCWAWVIGLLFFGMLATHDYTLARGIGALICTVIGICLLLFIGLLFINVTQDVIGFVWDIYEEVSYRMY